jgi:hypothetical protein
MGTLLEGHNCGNECGNVGIYKGCILWGTLLDEHNFGNECGNVSIMDVFYRYSLGWTEF